MKASQILKPFALLLLMLSGASFGKTAETTSIDAYAHHALIKGEGAGPYFHFPLAMEVYRGSLSPGLRDLRVFNAAGEMVPHALTLKTDIPQPKVVQTELRGFPLYSDEKSENGGIRIRRENNGALVSIEPAKATVTRKMTGVILDASRIAAPLVALDISLKEYNQPFQHFRIDGSDDLKDWHGVQDSASIAVLEQDGSRIEQRQVELPSIRAKYLRLTWLDPQEISSLPRITVTSSSVPQQSQPEILWTEAISPIRSNASNGEYFYRLNGTLPAERIRFILPQLNTLAPAQLLVRSNDKQPWRRVSSTVLYRLASQGGESLSPDIDLGGESMTELQLKLDTRAGGVGDQPVQIKIAVKPQQLVFLARGNGPFTLAWGLAGVNASALPLATLVPAYRSQNGLPGNAANLAIDEASTPISPASVGTEAIDPAVKQKWILWGVLVAGAVLLLFMAMKLLRSGENVKS
ncbi:MAG: DUF3999 domain-containing protein [Sideroxyarcus sp.]|nr:DUF3999 domain-containing protein [Sideroxyarcus sp.]